MGVERLERIKEANPSETNKQDDFASFGLKRQAIARGCPKSELHPPKVGQKTFGGHFKAGQPLTFYTSF
ncbi:hypothetical protein JCM6294_3345 [Bacteroides pyogenes DSM 20611 = JCM 6294]|uniref:Uncharacterized protein n=1 Tax=Bacteroides pyogenes DSM 20611 = JCM 6294 TaxID=1121100 RepID=W4PK42_9BACE|nr:hypothetical protein JCM6294_3345 [Bacteroides pyogenes DSM 20611 = JCM 6294]